MANRITSILFAALMFSVTACGGGSEVGDDEAKDFAAGFPVRKTPYILTDSALSKHADTTRIRNAGFVALIHDSVLTALFGKTTKIEFYPLAKVEAEGETYLVTKAVSGGKSAAILVVVGRDSGSAAMPFLRPDADPKTTQRSSIDDKFSIVKSTIQSLGEDAFREGKDVYAYNAAVGSFTLIVQDALQAGDAPLSNPLDTMRRVQPLSGDYVSGKRNLVSIRDGRSANEVQFYIHYEKSEECSGELKGYALFTSSKTAVYREGSNPCVLELSFAGNRVTLKETAPCGTHRSVKCAFEGSYTRPKPTTPVPAKSPTQK